MRKIIAMAFAAATVVACNNAGSDTTTTGSDTTTVGSETSTMETNDTVSSMRVAPDTAVTTTTTTTTTYTPVEGDITYTGKKVRVMKNGTWTDVDDDLKMDNDVVVYKNGKVKRMGKEVELKEGEVVDKTGNIFDKTGKAISKGWEATKDGVGDAAKGVKNAAEKVGNKVGDVVNGRDKDKKKD